MSESKTERRKKQTIDMRLAIQVSTLIVGILAIWYGSQTMAAVMEERLESHIESTIIHPDFEKLTKQFVPREEVQLYLKNIEGHVKAIKDDIEKIEKAMTQIQKQI